MPEKTAFGETGRVAKSEGKPLSVGIVVHSLFDSYQHAIVSGIRAQARALGIRIICYNAGLYDHSEFLRAPKHDIFTVINASVVDAIILMPGILLWENGERQLAEILRLCEGIPMICVGAAIDGIPSIVVDNAIGLNRMFDHFISIHNSRRIAYVRGPVASPEAEERYKAYLDSLERHGIPFDPQLVFIGNYEPRTAPKAIMELCDNRRVEFDTIICYDDDSALMAIDELRKRGFRIPEDVRVGGFDDIDISHDSSPPLSTVRQPLFELGCMGLQLTNDLLCGENVPMLQNIPTHPVIRSSCGCSMTAMKIDLDDPEIPPDESVGEDSTHGITSRFLKEIFPFNWEPARHKVLFENLNELHRLVGRILDDPEAEGELYSHLSTTIDTFEKNGLETALWRDILKRIFIAEVRERYSDSPAQNRRVVKSEHIELKWKSILTVLKVIETVPKSRKRMELESELMTIQLIGHKLAGCVNIDEIRTALSEYLQNTGISSCRISLYTEDRHVARQYFSLDEHCGILKNEVEFPSSMLVAEGTEPASSYLVTPLIVENGKEGFAVFEFEKVNRCYEVFAEQISSALHVAFLLEKINKQSLVLRESGNEDIRIILNSIGDAVIATDAAGVVMHMNMVAEKLTGWSGREAIGSLIFRILGITHDDEISRIKDSFSPILYKGQADSSFNCISITAKNGSRHQINYSGAPIRNINGATTGIVLVIRDLTEQLLMEEQLRQTQKMESLGQLASGITHDLNNMLTGILGYAQMIDKKAAENEELRKYAKSILNIAGSATDLMRSLLTFAHKTAITANLVDIHDCLATANNILIHSIGKRISISLNKNATSPKISGEAALIQNVIINLCLNARDAMPDGGTLTISTGNVVLDQKFCNTSTFEISPGRYVSIEVRDTGRGMSQDVLKHLFEPFFTTKEIGEGTGLGLSAVYGIVKSHKGAVTVHSRPGEGTVFVVYLPEGN